MNPTITILAGPNGAGKSFYSNFLVQKGFLTTHPINIDALEILIDTNRLPYDPMRFERSRKQEIDRIFNYLCKEAIDAQKDFSYECNLRLDQLKCINLFVKADYDVNIIYIWLDSLEKSEQRVMVRLNEGGHFVGKYSINENFYGGIKNFDESVAEKNWNHVLLIDNNRDVKSKGDNLTLLLEMHQNEVINISDNFFSNERKSLLPNICNFLNNKEI